MAMEIPAHLSKELRAQYKRRSMGVRKGDEVKVLRGQHAGKSGAVSEVDTGAGKILVSGITLKRTVGTEKQIPLEPSNLVITSLNLGDSARQRILLRKVKEVVVPKPKPVAAEPAKAEAAEKEEPAKAEAKPETEAEAKAEKPVRAQAAAKPRKAAAAGRGGD